VVVGPGFPRVALGLAWIASGLGTGTLAWLLDFPARWVPAGLAVAGIVATDAVVSNKGRSTTLALSSAASVAFVAGGVLAGALAAMSGADTGAALLAAVAPVVGGAVAFRLTDRARDMSRDPS
jgi:hypothetical protein